MFRKLKVVRYFILKIFENGPETALSDLMSVQYGVICYFFFLSFVTIYAQSHEF